VAEVAALASDVCACVTSWLTRTASLAASLTASPVPPGPR
jgi:hypothetical protein